LAHERTKETDEKALRTEGSMTLKKDLMVKKKQT